MNTLQTLLPPGLIPLDGGWQLVEMPLDRGADGDSYAEAVAAAPVCAAHVPGDVNGDLFAAGLLPDPLVGLNSGLYAARVPQRSWWYRTTFATPETLPDGRTPPPFAELRLEGLDVHADVWLNGAHLGHHASDFIPFAKDVTRVLRPHGEENLLVVRLTTGREVAEAHPDSDFPLFATVPTEAGRGYPLRGFPKRVFLRKPAYSWGWDWSPALPTCGITGPASLRFHETFEIDHVALCATLSEGSARVDARIELRSRLSVVKTAFGCIRLRLTEPGTGRVFETAADDVLVRGGMTDVRLSLDIPDPALWWPNGSGAQPLYTVEAWLDCDGRTAAIRPFQWGLRTIERECRPGVFRFKVNGVPIFVQGANWVPSDHLVGRTTPERLERLVEEAAFAHFNCLRVWGGGRYELDAFYDACDRRGILLWHDFMAACSPLPYDDPEFAGLCRDEARYQVRRLQRHPCMMQWCGNNEVGQAFEWRPNDFRDGEPADAFYYDELPRIVMAEAPGTPYTPTSPYGGRDSVDDPRVGDSHHWIVMRPDSRFWSCPEYWDGRDIPLFNSEYGYGGPCSLASTREYLGTETPDLRSAEGREHTNTFYDIPRVDFSIAEHYGAKENRPLEEYILLGGLCQGLNLGYSLESLRANGHTWGGLFWMYDDSWGENGWTIIDHYLRRKISYYGVRRALAPRKLLLRRGGAAFGGTDGEILLLAINAGDSPLRCTVEAGYRRYDGMDAVGATAPMRTIRIDVPPRTKGAVVATFPVPTAEELRSGTIMAAPVCGDGGADGLEGVSWRSGPHRSIEWPAAAPRVVRAETVGDDLVVTVETDAYAHAVHFLLGDDARPDDDYFDLLLGERRVVRIPGAARDAARIAVDAWR